MRVLHLLDDMRVGGAQRVLAQLCNELAGQGHAVAIGTQPGPMTHALDLRCEIHHLPPPTNRLSYLRDLRKLLKHGRFDLVHAHQRGVSALARIALTSDKAPLVEHVHTELPRYDRRWSSYRSDHMIAVGSSVARMLIEGYGRAQNRVHLIPNGIADRFKAAVPMPASLDNGPLRLLAIGRLEEQKGPWRFIETVRQLVAVGVDCTGLWIGDGSLRGDFLSRLDATGLRSRIELHETMPDVSDALRWCHALVLLSEWEGLPLVVLEAFSAGRAVVARDVGSVSDAVDGHVGLLVPKHFNVEEIAAAVARAICSDAAVAQFGQAARTRYEESFTVETVAARVSELYETVTRER